ncbi:MAG TPA: ABC transporter ATP-binding protein [Chthoniobacteraceae bacterium]|nr:ABC transporter ATP-binding protein [Chthoniobacteraceae bacterium]
MIRLNRVTRAYPGGVVALDEVSLEIAPHEFVAVTGPSGCGKSTLMHMIGGLDTPTSGEVYVNGLALHRADDAALTEYRRRSLGIVFQFFNLLPAMTVLENVTLPLLLAGGRLGPARETAREWLERAGLSHRLGHFPHQLSGGEMQRTAIARALVHRPAVLLADEPTGNLDSANAAQVIETLQKIASQQICTMVIVTHSEEVARIPERRIVMRDGKIEPIP